MEENFYNCMSLSQNDISTGAQLERLILTWFFMLVDALSRTTGTSWMVLDDVWCQLCVAQNRHSDRILFSKQY